MIIRTALIRVIPSVGVAHPCHPSFLLDQDTPEARADRFGGDGGKQDIVMSMICGEDAVFEKMQETAHDMYAAEHAYVMTSEQIAFLEPTLVELLGAGASIGTPLFPSSPDISTI